MTNMETKKVIYTEEFYNTLNLMINAEDLEQFEYKSNHIFSILDEMKKAFSKSELNQFRDEFVQGMVESHKKLTSVA